MSESLQPIEYDNKRAIDFGKRALRGGNLPPNLRPDKDWLDENGAIFADALIGVYLDGPNEEHPAPANQRRQRQEQVAYTLEFLQGASDKRLVEITAENPMVLSKGIREYALQVASLSSRTFKEPDATKDPSLGKELVSTGSLRIDDTVIAIMDAYAGSRISPNYAAGLLWVFGQRDPRAGTEEAKQTVLHDVSAELVARIRKAIKQEFCTSETQRDNNFKDGCVRINQLMKYLQGAPIEAVGAKAFDELIDIRYEFENYQNDNPMGKQEYREGFEASIAYALNAMYGSNRVY